MKCKIILLRALVLHKTSAESPNGPYCMSAVLLYCHHEQTSWAVAKKTKAL